MTCSPNLTTTQLKHFWFAVLTNPIRISSDHQFRRHLLMRKCPDELRLTQHIPSNSYQSRFGSHFRFCNVLICSTDAVGNVRPIHREVGQCVSHCLCRCSCTGWWCSSFMLGSRTELVSLQCPDPVQWLRSCWCLLCAPTSLSRLETHRSSTPPWSRPREHTRLHRRHHPNSQLLCYTIGSTATASQPAFMKTSLRKTPATNERLSACRDEPWSTTTRQYYLAQLLLVDVRNVTSSMSEWKNATANSMIARILRCPCSVWLWLPLRSTCGTLSMRACLQRRRAVRIDWPHWQVSSAPDHICCV